MNFTYKTQGTCSQKIDIEIDGTKVKNVKFSGGCMGNLTGISSLVKGMEIDEVIDRLAGIRCGFKPTSCPDQLARALSEIRKNHL